MYSDSLQKKLQDWPDPTSPIALKTELLCADAHKHLSIAAAEHERIEKVLHELEQHEPAISPPRRNEGVLPMLVQQESPDSESDSDSDSDSAWETDSDSEVWLRRRKQELKRKCK